MPKPPRVALYWPNILCYARILLALVGLFFVHRPVLAVVIWISSAFLDLIDGPFARKLHQTSDLGVLLDIAADNVLRTCTWLAAATTSPKPPNLAVIAFIISLEWMTMISTQLHTATDGSHWKRARSHDPKIVQTFFANNFCNPLGLVGIYGLFSAGIFLYGSKFTIFRENIPFFTFWKLLAYAGRSLSACIELYFCASYFRFVIQKDEMKRSS
jgi:phosphatidylglycerophosphate synthase